MASLFTKLLVLLTAGSRGYSWSRVELSTCDVPMAWSPVSLCCQTNNIPEGASIYFYAKQDVTEKFTPFFRLKPPCTVSEYADPPLNFTVHNSTCEADGGNTIYKLNLSLSYSMSAGEHWGCGFYGNFSSFTLNSNQVLTMYHGNVLINSSDTVILNWTLYNPTRNQMVVNIYGPSGDRILLIEDQNVTYFTEGFNFIGNILSSKFGVRVTKLSPGLNGTYVCVYDNTSGISVRDGVTLVFVGQPRIPDLRLSEPFETSTKYVVSGHMYCNSSSQSAAPLYYKPRLDYKWMIPSYLDDPNFSGITIDNNSILIPQINCLAVTSLPVYCQAMEGSHASYHSAPKNLSSFCGQISAPSKKEYNSLITVLVTLLFLTVFILVTTLSVVIVVGRKFLRRKYGRCCSSSDSDSDLASVLEQSREEELSRLERRNQIPNILRESIEESSVGLGDGLATRQEERAVQEAIERFAMEESMQTMQNRLRESTDTDSLSAIGEENEGFEGDINLPIAEGAVGGVPEVRPSRTHHDRTSDWQTVDRLLDQHNVHLSPQVIQMQVDRSNIVHHLLQLYDDPNLAVSRVTIRMIGEQGMDCGGVAEDMFTKFWYESQAHFFLGYEMVVPYLPLNRWEMEEQYYRIFGRIMSHTVAITKALPLPLCKSAIIVMIFDTTNVDKATILEDFLFFLDPVDRQLVTSAMNNFKALTREQIDEIQTIFTRFDYPAVIQEKSFHQHLTGLARNTLCIRPKPLLDLMRAGIPPPHFDHFWSMLNISYLEVLFRALRPTPDRVIARLKTDPIERHLAQRQKRVYRYLQDFITEISQPELETFLHFLTGSKTTPRQALVVCFTKESGFQRAPKAHTCSNMLELPETYEDYKTFKSEFKHLLAADETMTMTMA